ncbi:hypothetical protein V7149_21685, partial [Bacillus sp. JJ1503]|uniref:hypothetical protein n=1 Tax=Bacillus sp. JJ1503 TaxID=3122956 RepID=UPI002FFF8B61
MYQIEVWHEGLNKYRVIKGNSLYVVQQKAEMQKRAWDEMWLKQEQQLKQRQDKQLAAKEKQEKKELAEKLTKEAIEQIDIIQNTLIYTLDIDDKINWNDLKDKTKFSVPKPKKVKKLDVPREPLKSDDFYQPKFGFLDNLFSSKKQKKIEKLDQLFKQHHEEWGKEKEKILKVNQDNNEKFDKELKEWNEEKEKFLTNQSENNKAVAELKESYLKGTPLAVVEYCDMVLTNSVYPDSFPKEYEIDYNENNK